MMKWYLVDMKKSHEEEPYVVYYRSEEEVKQLKNGDTVLLNFKSDIIHSNERYGELLAVIVTERDNNHFKGMLVEQPKELMIAVGDIIEFSDENIAITAYDNPNIDIWIYYLDRFVKISKDVLERNEVNILEKSVAVAEKLTGWTAYSGYENNDFLQASDNYVYIVVGELLQIDDTILDILDSRETGVYNRDSSGKFIKIR